MHRKLSTLILTAAALLIAPLAPAIAADAQAPRQHQHNFTPAQKAQFQQRRAAWQKMSPQERQAAMQQHMAQREAKMTPAQKAQFEQRRAAWEKMTPQERQAAMQQRQGSWKHDGQDAQPQNGQPQQ